MLVCDGSRRTLSTVDDCGVPGVVTLCQSLVSGFFLRRVIPRYGRTVN